MNQDHRYGLVRHGLGRLQHSEPRNPYVTLDGLAGSEEVGPETDRIVVYLIKRHPCDGTLKFSGKGTE